MPPETSEHQHLVEQAPEILGGKGKEKSFLKRWRAKMTIKPGNVSTVVSFILN
jgi:hypothetical protein